MRAERRQVFVKCSVGDLSSAALGWRRLRYNLIPEDSKPTIAATNRAQAGNVLPEGETS